MALATTYRVIDNLKQVNNLESTTEQPQLFGSGLENQFGFWSRFSKIFNATMSKK
ncbi:hypothetical protein ACUR5C_15975 [Aliikangiella sp. IMCC44653]